MTGDPHDQQTPEQPPGGGRARGTVWLALTVVLGTLVLLWGADRLARWGAESALTRAVQEQTGGLERPVVRIEGGPVLLQVLRGRYDHVQVALDSVSSGPLRLQDYTAELDGVFLSFHDLLDGNTGGVFVEDAAEEAFLRTEDLQRYLRFTGRPLAVEGSADGRLRLSGPVEVLGEAFTASAVVELGSDGATLLLRPVQLDAGRSLQGLAELLVTQRFSLRVPLDPLPFAGSVTGIELRENGLEVRTAGRAVVVG